MADALIWAGGTAAAGMAATAAGPHWAYAVCAGLVACVMLAVTLRARHLARWRTAHATTTRYLRVAEMPERALPESALRALAEEFRYAPRRASREVRDPDAWYEPPRPVERDLRAPVKLRMPAAWPDWGTSTTLLPDIEWARA